MLSKWGFDLPSGKVPLNAGVRIGGRVCIDWEKIGISDAHQAIRPKTMNPSIAQLHHSPNALISSHLHPVYEILSPSTPVFASLSMLLSFRHFLFSSSPVLKRGTDFSSLIVECHFPASTSRFKVWVWYLSDCGYLQSNLKIKCQVLSLVQKPQGWPLTPFYHTEAVAGDAGLQAILEVSPALVTCEGLLFVCVCVHVRSCMASRVSYWFEFYTTEVTEWILNLI